MTADARATAWLDRLEGLHTAATGGEWKVAAKGGIDAGDYDTVISGGPVDCMAYCYGGSSTLEGDNLPADAAAIVAEHNAMPALLALVRGVTALAEELREWRNNAERFAATVVDGPDYERALGRVRAYERAIEGLDRLLADAAPDTGEETA